MIEQVANILGVKLYEEFEIRTAKLDEILGFKDNILTFRFTSNGLFYKDSNEYWYESGCDTILYNLILGNYRIFKLEK